jgi:glyoxylase-like metal-dependent hydrolase (beta-lactamase superfamily II)
MAKAFASATDTAEQKFELIELAKNVYSYSAAHDPNNGVIIGDDACMVVDTRATPKLAREFIDDIRKVTDKPIEYIALTHYHAVRTLGGSAYGAKWILASQNTFEWITQRGKADWDSEYHRFPRLFEQAEEIPGLTIPNVTFKDRMSVWLSKDLEVQLIHPGKGHTKGDTLVWLPKQKIVFTGELVEERCLPYAGDGYVQEWLQTLESIRDLGPETIVCGRGPVMRSNKEWQGALDITTHFLTTLIACVKESIAKKEGRKATFERAADALRPDFGHMPLFDHALPFSVIRAHEELTGEAAEPQIWTAEKDAKIWEELNG